MSKIINITKSAEEYLAKLVADKDDESIGIRIFISDPGTPKAETCLAYCKSNEADPSDELIQLDTLDAFIDKRSIPFLKDAEVNFDHDNFGGQLTIKAPNARFPNISADSPVEDRINYVIYNEINQVGVPESALTIQGNTAFVYIVNNSQVEKRNVEIGKRNFGKVSIISGVSEGDLVVSEGISKVRDKAKVKIIKPKN